MSVDEIKERLEDIEGDKWEWDERSNQVKSDDPLFVAHDIYPVQNGEFIAHAPEDIEYLLDRCETLEEALRLHVPKGIYKGVMETLDG